jgi:hypothetical protein
LKPRLHYPKNSNLECSKEWGVRSEMTRVNNLQNVLLNPSYFSLLTFCWLGEHRWQTLRLHPGHAFSTVPFITWTRPQGNRPLTHYWLHEHTYQESRSLSVHKATPITGHSRTLPEMQLVHIHEPK